MCVCVLPFRKKEGFYLDPAQHLFLEFLNWVVGWLVLSGVTRLGVSEFFDRVPSGSGEPLSLAPMLSRGWASRGRRSRPEIDVSFAQAAAGIADGDLVSVSTPEGLNR